MPKTQERPPPADVLLADGTVAVIRLLGEHDGDQLHALHDRVSDETLRLRFFSVGRHAPHQYVDHLVRDRPLTMILERSGRILGVATAEPVQPDTAEVSFLVQDGSHGLGIGSLLLEHLAAAARARGVATFLAEVLLENHAMLDVLTDAGFTLSRKVDDGRGRRASRHRADRAGPGHGRRERPPRRGAVAAPAAPSPQRGRGRSQQ